MKELLGVVLLAILWVGSAVLAGAWVAVAVRAFELLRG